MRKKYRAIINLIDKDYRAFTGSEEITVSSWDEAEEYCRKSSWSGYDYYVYGLVDDEDRVGYFSKKEFVNGVH